MFKKRFGGSGFSEVFHYNSHLVGYEVFGVATIVGLAQVLYQGRTVGDPTHKVVGGCVGVVVGEVEHGEVLFAVAFDFHFVYGILMGYLWGFKELSVALTCAIYGTYLSYLWQLHVLSMALTCAIYGSYMSYLWQLRRQPGNMASSFCNHYILILVL